MGRRRFRALAVALALLAFAVVVSAGGCSAWIDGELSSKTDSSSGGAGGVGGTASSVGGAGGSPACTSADDCQPTGIDCSVPTCDAGSCGVVAAVAGTPCADGVCDGADGCVACVDASQCDVDEACAANVCVPAHCVDAALSGDESDVDCGGSCPPCDDGSTCVEPSDCLSKFCDTSAGVGGVIAGVCAPCVDSTDCSAAGAYYCDAGVCVDKKVDGAICATPSECLSGHCPSDDGVCCDAACDATCQACLGIKTGASDGACGAVTATSDPDAECSDQGAVSCGADGSGCNGIESQPGCRLYDASTPCAPPTCTSGTAIAAASCDGNGSCAIPAATNCDPYVCNAGATACLPSCATSGDCSAGFYCDTATSSCLAVEPNGSACSAGGECASGHCADGVCCDTACSATCVACNVFGSEGTCTPHQTGTNPDGDCVAGQACDGAALCKKVGGQACATAGECLSGFCPPQDGVCCDQACGATCQACTTVKTGVATGTCSAVLTGADPDNECAAQGPMTCGSAGAGCNGVQGAPGCNLYPVSTECTAPVCAAGEQTSAGLCDGTGSCVPGSVSGCGAYACGPSACLTSCAGGGDCSANHYCDAPACLPTKANGVSCGLGVECQSGNCVDGVCCASACNGSCLACSTAKTGGADGLCGFVSAGSDPDSECMVGQSCNGSGTCLGSLGTSCSVGGECVSGNCVDGVCCDIACSGTCSACSAAKTGGTDGACGFVAHGIDPDLECGAGNVCDGAGMCIVGCDQFGCLSDAACTPAATSGSCQELPDDCRRAACVGQVIGAPIVAGVSTSQNFNNWQSADDPTAANTNRWHCNVSLPVSAAGTLTSWDMFVDSGGSNGEAARFGVIRCSAGGGGSGGPVLSGCTRVGLGPAQTISGNGLHSFSLAGSTQLDGAVADPTGIVVNVGDWICAQTQDYDIGVDCNGSPPPFGCPGPDFNTQRRDNLISIGQPFALTDPGSDGTMMIRAIGVEPDVPGVCSETVAEMNTTPCMVSGGDTCCGASCIVGPSGPGTCM